MLGTILTFFIKTILFFYVLIRWIFVGRRSEKTTTMENQKQLSTNNKKDNVLPNLVLEKILRMLSVTDRLRLERVDWHWNGVVWKHGWKGQKGLDYKVVFKGAQRVNPKAFTNESLVALFKRINKNLIELNICEFFDNRLPITAYICGSLPLLPNLVKIDIQWIELLEAVPFLPDSLHEICSNGPFTEAALSALAKKCPDLEGIEFDYERDDHVVVSWLNDFLLKYPSLKKLNLCCTFLEGEGRLMSIAELKELEEIELSGFSAVHFEEETFEAMIKGCKRFRRIRLYVFDLFSEESFFGLAKLPNLVELGLYDLTGGHDHPSITDSIVKAISKCLNLKRLDISLCCRITDDSIVYLVEHCKTLVSLHVGSCPQITEISLEAVIAEVNRRHGKPPKSLPKGPADKRIFYFTYEHTGIDHKKALNVTANNPWLELESSKELGNRLFL